MKNEAVKNGVDLFEELCKNQLFSKDQIKRGYAVELMAAFDYMGEDLYPLLEQAEAEGKRIFVEYSKGPDCIKTIISKIR